MSAPTTNIDRQKRRHRGVLAWMAIATGFVGLMFIVFYAMATNDDEAETTTPAATVSEEG